MNWKHYVIVLILILSLGFASSHLVMAQTKIDIPRSFSCPTHDPTAPKPTIDKDGDGKLDRLYKHYQDSKGNDFEVWCLDHGETGDFGFYASFPNGTSTRVDSCELICGMNNKTLTVVNGTGTVTKTGNETYSVNGTITGYHHDNWVTNPTSPDYKKDFHSDYNYSTSKYVKHITTIISFHPYKDVINKTKSYIITPDGIRHPLNRVGMLLSPENPPSFGYPASYTPGTDDDSTGLRVLAYDLTVQLTHGSQTFEVFYPETIQINSMTYENDKKSLTIDFSANHEDYMNISIPRDLVDHGDNEMFVVTENGKDITSSVNETYTDSFRTLFMSIDKNSSEVTITGTLEAVPEFGPISIVVLAIAMMTLLVVFSKFGSVILNHR